MKKCQCISHFSHLFTNGFNILNFFVQRLVLGTELISSCVGFHRQLLTLRLLMYPCSTFVMVCKLSENRTFFLTNCFTNSLLSTIAEKIFVWDVLASYFLGTGRLFSYVTFFSKSFVQHYCKCYDKSFHKLRAINKLLNCEWKNSVRIIVISTYFAVSNN